MDHRQTAILISRVVTCVALLLPATALAFPGTSGQTGARGYWFYQSPPVDTLRPPSQEQPAAAPSPRRVRKSNPCRHESTWSAGCGFITPHSFSFQARERDALLHAMVMQPQNQKAVKAVQKYTRWVVDQAISAARMWQYNSVQDPNLSGTATAPISAYGLNLAFSVHALNKKAAWAAVKRFHGVLILFTKHDCTYCQSEVPLIRYMERDTGLKVWQASLQGPCDKSFAKHCVPKAQSLLPARLLHVSIVPTLFLYLPKNVWIRVFAGLTTTDTAESNLYNFFVAWREAAMHKLKGFGHAPAMDFNPRNRPNPEQMQAFLENQIPTRAKSNK